MSTRLKTTDFYPRSPCGERLVNSRLYSLPEDFYPRSPCGERRCEIVSIECCSLFLSTLSLRRATQQRLPDSTRQQISIHALLAESDSWATCWPAGGRTFLSTLSLRRATLAGLNIRQIQKIISIHALLAESDSVTFPIWVVLQKFLSTLSLRRATHNRWVNLFGFQNFYPRSPCGERLTGFFRSLEDHNFYPRSPCGERPYDGLIASANFCKFLSTLSLRRATCSVGFAC